MIEKNRNGIIKTKSRKMKDEKKMLIERENMNDGCWNAIVFFSVIQLRQKEVSGDKEVTKGEKREKSRSRENNKKV